MAQKCRLHIFLARLHLIHIAANGVNLPVMYDKTVRMRPLPARIRIGRKTGVHNSNRRYISFALQILKECSELVDQEHSFVYDRPAAERYHIGIIRTLLKNPPCNIEPSVKGKPLLDRRWFPDKCLHNAGHTLYCLMP